MKKNYLFLLVLPCIFITAFACPKAYMDNVNQGNEESRIDVDANKGVDFLQINDDAGEIYFEKKSVDLGDINTNEKPLRVEFKFKNVGNSPFVIKKAMTSNREFNVSFPESPIAPGAEATIIVSGTVQSGRFKKAVTVLTTGKIEMSRLYISGNNIGEGLTEPTLVGESVISWVNKHKGTFKDLPQEFIYDLNIQYIVGPDLRIKDVEYEKQGLPQAIIEDINKLITNMPDFESGHRRGGFLHLIYKNEITNPQDTALLDLFEKDPDELLKIVDHAKRHFQNMDMNTIVLGYVIERDGSITNIQTQISSGYYSKPQIVSTLKTFISEIRDEVKNRNVKSTKRRTRIITKMFVELK